MSLVSAHIDIGFVTLDVTDIDTLFATPVTLVAAPGAGIALVPLTMTARRTQSTGVWSAVRALQVQYSGDTTQLSRAMSFFWTSVGTRDEFGSELLLQTLSGANNFDPSNKALELTFTVGDMTPGASDTLLRVHLLYAKISGLY